MMAWGALRKLHLALTRLRAFVGELLEPGEAAWHLPVARLRYAAHTLSFDEASPMQKRWALASAAQAAAQQKRWALAHPRSI